MKCLIKYMIILVFMGLLFINANAQTTYTWNGGSGNWNTAENWSPAGVPTSTDNVVITATGTYTVTLDVDATISDISIGGTSGIQSLSLSSRTLTINGTGAINDSGRVSMNTSTINGSGTLTNSGTFTAYDGILSIDFDNAGTATFRHYCSINNALTTQPNSTIHIHANTSYNTLTIANGFTNHGLLYFTNSGYTNRGTVAITDGTLINASDGTIQSTSIPLYSNYSNSILAPLNNQGTVTLSQGFILNEASAMHTNSGTFNINQGSTLYLTQTGTTPSFTNTGIFTVDSAAAISVSGGFFDYQVGAFTLDGSFSATNNATIQFEDNFTNMGSLSLNASTLTCNSELNNQNTISMNTSTINGSGILNNTGTLTVWDGTLSIDFDNAGTANFSHYCTINNAITTQTTSIIRMYCTATYNTLTIADGFTNHGLLYFTNDAGYTSRGTIDITTGTLTNAPDGTIQSTSIPLYTNYGNSILAPLDNQGTVTLSQGFILNRESAVHTNSGTLNINQGGTLYLTQSGTDPSFTSNGILTVDSAAAISVSGGSFDYLPGTFTFSGSFTAANSAEVNFSDAITNSNQISLNQSTLTCNSSFTNMGNLALTNSTMTCAMELNNQNAISMNTSTINGSGTLTNSGTLTAYDGILGIDFNNAGTANFSHYCAINNTITTQASSVIRMYCTATYNTLTIANEFTNHGLLYFTNDAGYTSRGTIDITTGTLINAPDGTIQSTSIPLYSNYCNSLLAPLNNQGTVTISQGFILNRESAVHTNSGTLNINEGGTLNLTQSGTDPSFNSTGILSVDSAATISVSGGSFDYLPGTFTLNGSFSASNNAAINFSDAFINSTQINLNQSTLTCDSIFTNLGNLALTNSTMTCAMGLNNQNTISMNTSTINGSGTLTNSGTLSAYTGILSIDFDNAGTANFSHTCAINNTITTQTSSIIRMYCTATYNTLTVADDFTNNGLIYFTNDAGYTSRGTINITTGTVTNAPGGTIQSTSIPLYSNYSNSILAPLDNQGTVTISQGFILNRESAAHTNSGTFNINQGGTLYLTQSGTEPSFTNTGIFTVDSAAAISVNGGFFDYQIGAFTLDGSFSATNNATIQFEDNFTNMGSLSLNASTFTCNSELNNQTGISINTSTINGSGTFTNSGTFTAYDGILSIDFDNAGTATFRHYCSINNALTTQPNSNIHIHANTSFNTLTIANGFTNHGLLYFTNSNYTTRGTVAITDGTLVNASDGTIQSTSIPLYSNYGNSLLAPLDNQGLITLSQGFYITTENNSHINSGQINLNGNTLTMSGQTFENTSDGDIGGNGTLNISGLSFANNGAFTAGLNRGLFNINNDLPMAVTSTLGFELAGPERGNFYNSFIIANQAQLNGTINIDLVDGYIPNTGQEFILSEYTTYENSFLVENGMTIGDYKQFELVYEDTQLKLITSETPGFSSPFAWNDTATVLDGDSIVIDVIHNDTDPNSEAISLISVGPASHGTAGVSGNLVTYTANEGSDGEDKFIYTVENSSGGRTSAFVIINTNPEAPATPVLAWPLNNADDVLLNTNLAWYPVTQVDSFEVQISTVITFNTGEELFYHGIVDTFVNVTLPEEDTYYWRVRSGNAAGYSQWTQPWQFSNGTPDNTPPYLLSQIPDQAVDEDFGNVVVTDLTTIFSDDDIAIGDSLIYSFSISSGIVSGMLNGSELQLNSVADSNGVTSVIVTATDLSFASVSDTFMVTITPLNDIPFVLNPLADITIDQNFGSLIVASLDTVFNDVDLPVDDTLSFSMSISNDLLNGSINGNELQLISVNDSSGMSTIIVTATDTYEESITDTFTITIINTNHTPFVENPIADLSLDENFGSVMVATLDTVFADVDMPADSLIFSMAISNNLITGAISGDELQLMSINDSVGISTVIVTATDRQAESVADTFMVTINNVNNAPLVENPIADQTLPENFSTYTAADLDTVFMDSDSPVLTFTAQTDGNTTAGISGSMLNLSSVEDFIGTSEVIITATDDYSVSVSDTFMVTVNDITSPDFFSGILPGIELKYHLNIYLVSDELLASNPVSNVTLRDASETVISNENVTLTRLTDHSSYVYYEHYELPDDGQLTITTTGQDASGNPASDILTYSVAFISKASAFNLATPDGSIRVDAKSHSFKNNGMLLLNTKRIDNNEAFSEVAKLKLEQSEIPDGWIPLENEIQLLSSADLNKNKNINLSVTYQPDFMKNIKEDLPDVDERKIGVYRLSDGQWTYTGGEGKESSVSAAINQLGRFAVFYNPDHVILPTRIALRQNYPNPFNPNTTIEFALPQDLKVKLNIYNILGQKIITLVDGMMEGGIHTVQWNGKNQHGDFAASGIYLYRLETPKEIKSQKMLLLK